MKKVIGLVWGLLPISVSAECVPVPDCASIGYTETSCEGDSLKCPFDTTKLYCPPCDSSYKYSCTGDNIKNPIGNTCNNKYAACECVAGATFSNGECICDTSCNTIGNIYYSDGTCNSCNITDKTPVGIVAYKDNNKHFIVSLETNIKVAWSTDQKDAEGNVIIGRYTDIPNLYNYAECETALTDPLATGKEQTKIIVEAYGENAVGVAAVYCYNYFPNGFEQSKNQWYLPALDEIFNIVVSNKKDINNGLSILGISALNNGIHWSSSERPWSYVCNVNSSNRYLYGYAEKLHAHYVTCLYSIE